MGVAVKVTLVPAQMVEAVALILTEAGEAALIVMIAAFDSWVATYGLGDTLLLLDNTAFLYT